MTKTPISATIDENKHDEFAEIAEREHGSKAAAIRTLIEQAVSADTTRLGGGDGVSEDVLREIRALRNDLNAGEVSITATFDAGVDADNDNWSVDVDGIDGLLDDYLPNEPVPDDLRVAEGENALAEPVLEQWAVILVDEGSGKVPELNPKHLPQNTRDRPNGEEHQVALGMGVLKYRHNHRVRGGDVANVFEHEGLWGKQYVRDQGVPKMIRDRLVEVDTGWFAVSRDERAVAVEDAHKKMSSAFTKVREADSLREYERLMKRASQKRQNYRTICEETGLEVDDSRDLDEEYDVVLQKGAENAQMRTLEKIENKLDGVESQVELWELESLDHIPPNPGQRDVSKVVRHWRGKLDDVDEAVDVLANHDWYTRSIVDADDERLEDARERLDELRDGIDEWESEAMESVKSDSDD